jgi:hypothetical protein
MRSVVEPYSALLKTIVCCAGESGMDVPPQNLQAPTGNRHESLSTDMIAEMGRKSRLPIRSGGEKTTLSPVTGRQNG